MDCDENEVSILSLSLRERKIQDVNFDRCNPTGQVLNLFPIDHRFESHKPSGPLKTYMVVNFRTRKINRDTRKLARTPILIKKKNVLVTEP